MGAGWDSKWSMVKGYFGNSDEHANSFREIRGEGFRTGAARDGDPILGERLLEALGRYRFAAFGAALKADLSCVPSEQFSPGVDPAAIRQLIDAALRQAKTAATGDFRGMVGREIASLVAGEVLSAIAVELGTSTGILARRRFGDGDVRGGPGGGVYRRLRGHVGLRQSLRPGWRID